MKKIAVFISGGGTNLEALADKAESYEVSLIIASRGDAMGLERGKARGIPSFHVGKENFPEEPQRTAHILTLLQDYSIDYIALAGYLSIVPKEIIDKYPDRILNIHPSLIPSFCGVGFHGAHVHEAVYESGVKITGATVHFVNETVDGGTIILQDTVPVLWKDTPEIIGRKVLKIEHEIFPKAMNLLASGKVKVTDNRTYIEE
ncbi:MAG: phosphoribosylglycinamide formyltransferase [Eubacteriales bacterium]